MLQANTLNLIKIIENKPVSQEGCTREPSVSRGTRTSEERGAKRDREYNQLVPSCVPEIHLFRAIKSTRFLLLHHTVTIFL